MHVEVDVNSEKMPLPDFGGPTPELLEGRVN